MEQLYSDLRKIAEHVHIPDLLADQTYFGEDYTHSNEDWATKLQQAGATFTFLAYSFGNIPMWALHVGVVLLPAAAHVGLHCHKDASREFVQVVHELGGNFGSFNDSQSANEWQYNKVFPNYRHEDFKDIGHMLGDTYVAVRAGLGARHLLS